MSDRSGDAQGSLTGGGEHTDAESAFERGNRLAKEGDLEGAEAAYRRAAEEGHPTAAAYAGVFAEARGEIAEAHEAYRRADERGDGYGAFKLGLLLSHSGDWDAATEAWDRADERGRADPPFDPAAVYRRGTAHEPVGEKIVGAEQGSPFSNPVLVGALTVLVVIVGVFLAYNANQGLPFVPTKELKVDIANGAQLVAGNDVREGGFRVGIVTDMRPIELPNGQVGAQLTLKLDQSHSRVPVDTTATVLPRSVLGLKYVALTLGNSNKVVPDGGTLPLSQTSVPVQFDDLNKMFDSSTRVAVQSNLRGFGDAFAARGSSLNDTIAALPELLRHLEPVARYLSDPSAELTRFLGALNGFFSTVSPVAQLNVNSFRDQATTFAAIVRDPNAYEQTIRESPSALDVSTASLRVQQPFLTDLTTVSRALVPGTAALTNALPTLNTALMAGIRVLPRTPPMNAKLQRVLSVLESLSKAPETNIALNALTQTVGTLNPTVRYVGPFQTVCDQWNYWWTFLSEHISEATNVGYAQRVMIMAANHQPNNVGQQGATAPANGYGPAGLPDQPDAEYLHAPNYFAAIDTHGNADCETGQRGYPKKLDYFDPKGRNLQTDPHIPGNQGPTYHGRPRVPAGETFTREPTPMTIPFLGSKQPVSQLPYNPSNP